MELIAHAKDGREICVTAPINAVFGEVRKRRNAVSVIGNNTETRQTRVLQQRVLVAVARDAAEIKRDQSFVRDLQSDKNALTVAAAVAGIA